MSQGKALNIVTGNCSLCHGVKCGAMLVSTSVYLGVAYLCLPTRKSVRGHQSLGSMYSACDKRNGGASHANSSSSGSP